MLEGQLVRLEPLSPEHEVDLFDASRDARIWRWLPVVQPRTPAQWRAWMEDALARATAGLDLPFATVLLATGRAVGSTRFLALRPEHGSVEIGWTWLAPSAWGTGANHEAKLLQLRHAFETWGCRRVELKTDAQNAPARRSMEAFGAVFEGVHRKHMLVRGGENRDSAWYSVVEDDWPAVRVRLEARLAKTAPSGGSETAS
jgi:RimJ/RimL family protein N-acetyltransferase